MTQQSINSPALHPFLQGLSVEHQRELTTAAQPFSANPGEFLAREGSPTHALFLIHSGHVEISTNLGERGATVIETVGAGQVIGWSWLLPPHRWQFDARATDMVQGIAIPADWLRDRCEQDHELGYHVFKQLLVVISSRLAATRVQRLDIFR